MIDWIAVSATPFLITGITFLIKEQKDSVLEKVKEMNSSILDLSKKVDQYTIRNEETHLEIRNRQTEQYLDLKDEIRDLCLSNIKKEK